MEEEDWFEIVLPAAKLRSLSEEEMGRVIKALTCAVGKDPRIEYLGAGQPPFQDFLLIVLEESENLEQLKPDFEALVSEIRVQARCLPRLMSPMNLEHRKTLASQSTSSQLIPQVGNIQRITSLECSLLLQESMKTTYAGPPTARWDPTGRRRKV